MCAGSLMDMLKMRLRHEWHIRWVHGSLADSELGMSSEPQVRHETSFGAVGGLGRRRALNRLGGFRGLGLPAPVPASVLGFVFFAIGVVVVALLLIVGGRGRCAFPAGPLLWQYIASVSCVVFDGLAEKHY